MVWELQVWSALVGCHERGVKMAWLPLELEEFMAQGKQKFSDLLLLRMILDIP